MEKETREAVLNIDTAEFENPFLSADQKDNVEGMLLYANYYRTPINHSALRRIGDNDVYSAEDSESGCRWTRSEILQGLACLFGYRRRLTVVRRNLLNVRFGMIVHQVNCKGVMGAGLAKSIREVYPVVYEKYKQLRVMQPGTIQLVKVNPDSEKYPLFVVNLFGQVDFGGDAPQTNIKSVKNALKKIKKIRRIESMNLPIYFPWKIGCGLGGGDWDEYSKLIMKYCPDAVVCRVDGV